LLDAFAPDPMPWHVVYPSSRNLSPKVRAFIELLEAHLARRARGSRD
jgi:DNA-binding transcriptional LysR family regulator